MAKIFLLERGQFLKDYTPAIKFIVYRSLHVHLRHPVARHGHSPIAMISRMVVIPGVITIPRNLTRWQRRKKWVLFMEAPACYVGESQKWLASILYPLSEVAGRISSEGKIFLMDIASHTALGHPCWWRKTWPELKINSLLIMEKCVDFCVMEYQ